MKDFEGKMIESFRKEVGFFAAVVIACSSPMAVVGNAFVLAAVWRKTCENSISFSAQWISIN